MFNIPIFLATGIPIFTDPLKSQDYEAPRKIKREEPSFSVIPMNPTTGQTWLNSRTGIVYIYNGQQWESAGTQEVFFGNADKSKAKGGDLWIY